MNRRVVPLLLAAVSALCLAGAPARAADPASTPVSAPIPASDFARLPALESPKLSPDGKSFAAKIAINGKQFFAIVRLDGSGTHIVPAGEFELNWWQWVNNDWLVIGIGQLMPFQGDQMYVSRAIGVKADGSKLVPLARDAAQDADDLLWVANDGSARVLLSYQTSVFYSEEGFWPKVEEIDLDSGHRRVVERGEEGVMSWFADGNGTVRMGIGHGNDGRSTRILYRPDARTGFRIVERAKTRDDDIIVPAVFLPDPGKALTFDDDDDGFGALYELDLTSLKRGKQLFASKGYDIGSAITDESGFKLLGVHVDEARETIRWLDPDLAAMQAEVSAKVQGAEARIVSMDADRSHAIVLVGGADAPGAYFIYDRKDGMMDIISYNNNALKLRRLNRVSTIRYKARDGLEIAAVLTLPRKGSGRNLPLIVMPHGGPFARDDESWDWWAQSLAERGYAVIQPNYRGSSGYGTQFAKKGEGQWGLAMQDDLNDAVSALAERGIADPKRVCMVGASYGGYAAIRAAMRDGALYRCAVSYAGVADLNGMLTYDSRFLSSGVRKDWMKKQAPDLKSVSPVNFPDRVSIPLLLVHGKVDQVVPVAQSRAMASRLKRAGKDVTYLEQPLADHHFTRAEDRLEFLTALNAFLDKWNPPGPAATATATAAK